MSERQDRQGARTPADLERKYNYDKRFAEVMGIALDAQKSVEESVAKLDAELSLKIGRDEKSKIVSMINASADIIRIKGNRLTIDSTYFTLSEEGAIKATAGEIGGCTIKNGKLIVPMAQVDGKLTADHIEVEDILVSESFKAAVEEAASITVGNVNVGGTNLLSKAEMGEQRKDISENSSSGFGYICPEGTSSVSVFGQTAVLGLRSDREYTISFYAWSANPYSVCWDLWVGPEDGDENELPQAWFLTTPKPTLYKFTFTREVDFLPKAALRFINQQENGFANDVTSPIYVTDIKVEEGNRATAWSPAFEDYSTTTEMYSAITQEIGKIDLTVYAKSADVEDELGKYATITEMQSALSLKADSASLGVYAKTEYVDGKVSGLQSKLDLKADSATLGSYATTESVDGKISAVESKIALGIGEDENGKKYAYLNANADKIKFDATKTIEINATNFTLKSDGEVLAKKGSVGGWDIDDISIHKTTIGVDEDEELTFSICSMPDRNTPWIKISGEMVGSGIKTDYFEISNRGDVVATSLRSDEYHIGDLIYRKSYTLIKGGNIEISAEEDNIDFFAGGWFALKTDTTTYHLYLAEDGTVRFREEAATMALAEGE